MKTISHILCLAVSCGLLVACSLDEQTFTFVSGEDVAAAGNYDQLVAGAYLTLDFPFEWGNYHNLANFDSDYQTGPGWAFQAMGAGNFFDAGEVNNVFAYYSQSIHRANYHYSLVSSINGVPEKQKNNALGELLFLKAWAQFQLVQYWGPIPLFTYSIAEGNQQALPRASVKDVYEHIISTLQEAETLLMSRKDAEYKLGHVCRGTAKALLAKVYATIGSASMPSGAKVTVKGGPGTVTNPDGTVSRTMPLPIAHSKDQVAGFEEFDSKTYYNLAREKAKEVIEEGEFSLADSQHQLWSTAYRNGPEFEFCLQTINQGTLLYNFLTSDYWGFLNETSKVWNCGYYVQRDHWLQLFDDFEDERITWGIMHRMPILYDEATGKTTYCFYPERDSVYVNRGERGYDKTDVVRYGPTTYGSKLKKFTAITTPIDGTRGDYNWPYMRYAETLLIFAEAENEINGPTAEAFNVINALNERNNSTKVSDRNAMAPYTQESFRSYILEERAKEFAGEGIRKLDLLRWGIYLQVMNAIDVDENGIIKRREAKHLLLPLPPNEVNSNSNIETNNPGW